MKYFLFGVVLAFMLAPTAFASSVFPSTNVDNQGKGWAFVEQVSKGEGTTDLRFVSTRNFYSCFEYRTDGDTSQVISENGGANYNTNVTDGLYPYFCEKNSEETEAINANNYVEVRLAFGAETDERFDWVRFDVLPKPVVKAKAKGFEKDHRCLGTTPSFVTWAVEKDGELTWSAEGGDKVELRFGWMKGLYPFKAMLTNDGHEKVGLGTDIGYWFNWFEMRTINGCKKGPWTEFN